MAKFFRVVGGGIPVRMSDVDAYQVVARDRDGGYCPKSVWKEERASEYRVSRKDNCLRKLHGEVASLQRHGQHKRNRGASAPRERAARHVRA